MNALNLFRTKLSSGFDAAVDDGPVSGLFAGELLLENIVADAGGGEMLRTVLALIVGFSGGSAGLPIALGTVFDNVMADVGATAGGASLVIESLGGRAGLPIALVTAFGNVMVVPGLGPSLAAESPADGPAGGIIGGTDESESEGEGIGATAEG